MKRRRLTQDQKDARREARYNGKQLAHAIRMAAHYEADARSWEAVNLKPTTSEDVRAMFAERAASSRAVADKYAATAVSYARRAFHYAQLGSRWQVL